MSAVPGLASSTMPPSSDAGARLKQRRSRILRERSIEAVLFLAALVSVFTTIGIVYVLVKESVLFFTHVSLWDFLTDTQWTPLFDDAHFGIMVLLSGTLTSSFVALAIAWRRDTQAHKRYMLLASIVMVEAAVGDGVDAALFVPV